MLNKCPKCGSKLDRHTGLCPACDAQEGIDGKITASSNKTLKKTIAISAVVVAFCITVVMLFVFDVIRTPAVIDSSPEIPLTKDGDIVETTVSNPNESDKPSFLDPDGMTDEEIENYIDDLLEPVDADRYFSEIGTVKGKISAAEAEKVTSERDTRKLMKERGFEDYPVLTRYDMDGNLIDVREIGSSSEPHPVYQMDYYDFQDRPWKISLINGVIYAALADETSGIPTVLAETDTLMGYDSATNTFYEYIPNAQTAVLKHVDVVNAEALEDYSGN